MPPQTIGMGVGEGVFMKHLNPIRVEYMWKYSYINVVIFILWKVSTLESNHVQCTVLKASAVDTLDQYP